MSPTDSELLRRFATQGDQSAFAELVHRHLPLVYNAALRRVNGNAHLAEEAAQLAFTQLARKAGGLSSHPALAGWLHTSTRYAASSLLRREARRVARESSAAAMPAETSRPDEPAWASLRPWLDDALDHLSRADREALLLRFFSNRSYAEIGTALSVSEDAARKRIERALDALRQRFARHGVTTTVAALATALTQAPVAAAPASLGATIAAGAAASGAGGSIGSALIGFMGMTKASTITLTAVSVAGLGVFGAALVNWEVQQRREAQQLATLATQVDTFVARGRALASQRSGPPDRTPPSGPLPGAGVNVPAAPDPAADQLALIKYRLQDAAFAPFRHEETRLRVQQEFGAFFESQQYSPEERRLAQDALVECYEAEEADQFGQLARDPNGTFPPLPNRREEMFAKLRPRLGETRLRDLQRCVMAQHFLPAAQQVGMDFADAGEPVSRAQETALAMVLGDGNTRIADRAARLQRDQLDPVSGLTAGERTQLDDAAAFLSSRQLAAFEAYLRERRLRASLTNRVMEQANAPQS